MSTAQLLLTANLAHTSGFAKDTVTNTFAFSCHGPGTLALDANNLADAVAGFYNNNGAGAQGIHHYLSPSLSRSAGGLVVKVYDITGELDGDPHGSPIYTEAYALGASIAPSGTRLPEEVALVVSLHGTGYATAPVERPDGADAGTAIDRPRQRQSGRLFLGPWLADAATTGLSRPNTTARGLIAEQCQVLKTAGETAFANWGVWSRKDAAIRYITEVAIDDAWDTQRRRGVAPTARTVTALT